MKHRMAFAAMAAGVITVAACADRDGGARLATEPGDTNPVVSYVTSGAAAIVDPETHRLTPVTAGAASRSGITASIAAGSQTSDALQVSSGEPGVARSEGKAVFTFTDDAHRKQSIVMLYRSGGGPPAAMQHYTDGVIVSTTAYIWVKTATGYVREQSVLRIIRNGALVGTYTTTTKVAPPKPGNGGGPKETVMLDRSRVVSPLQKAVGAAAYGLAFAFAPEEANAQNYHFADCRQEWLRFAGASVVLAAAASALAAAPQLTPILISAFVAALTTTAAYEDALLDCILAHERFTFGGFGGSGAAGGGGGGGGWDCFEGSYAAHCTTPFSL
jgi:hypothetical protein